MAIARYLAMTAAEIQKNAPLSGGMAWLGCHFSPYGRGLSNLPPDLPERSLLILDDITPIHGHDPEYIAEQLCWCAEVFSCRGVLLDFQRQGYEESKALAQHLSQVLPCPLGVTPEYADGLSCAIFLPPVPCHTPLKDFFAPCQGREIWLDMALNGEVLNVRENGTEILPLPHTNGVCDWFQEESLHCHYQIEERDEAIIFTLGRSREDLEALLEDAEAFGVTTAVGLYQELG